jgi:hypothetical protein
MKKQITSLVYSSQGLIDVPTPPLNVKNKNSMPRRTNSTEELHPDDARNFNNTNNNKTKGSKDLDIV